ADFSISGTLALRVTLRGLQAARVPPRADREAVELLGWLELALDDAPALVITGFNEERVPKRLNGDLFLPNELRRVLELEDNDRCLARDAYALEAIVASRPDVRIVFGRRTAEGDPLTPSRLLFAADDTTIAHRVRDWFGPRPA